MQNYNTQIRQELNIGTNGNLPSLYSFSLSIYNYQADM